MAALRLEEMGQGQQGPDRHALVLLMHRMPQERISRQFFLSSCLIYSTYDKTRLVSALVAAPKCVRDGKTVP